MMIGFTNRQQQKQTGSKDIGDSNRLILERYPVDRSGNLQAWDAADVYLLETIKERLKTDPDDEVQSLAILHDNFGALTLPFLNQRHVSYGDSWMSKQAIENNIALNKLDAPLRFESDLRRLCEGECEREKELASGEQIKRESPRLLIGRVPKSKAQFSFLLSQLRSWVDDDCELYLAGMDKHLSKGQYDLIARYFGPSEFLPGVKKARVWRARVDKTLSETYTLPAQVRLNEFDLSLQSEPNVFSADKLDIGTRFLLGHFSKLPNVDHVADLACGSGVIGLSYLRRFQPANLHFYDESFQAIESTKQNYRVNFQPELDGCDMGSVARQHDVQVNFHVGDGLKSAKPGELELVITNPPFHQFNAINKDIANAFFKDSYRSLKDNGELWLVANRHLGYHSVLKRIFGNCQTVVGNQKFVILRACKQSNK